MTAGPDLHGNLLMAPTLPGFATGAGLVAALLYAIAVGLIVLDIRRHQPTPLDRLLPLLVLAIGLHGVTAWQQINQPAGFYFGIYTAGAVVTLIMTTFVTLASLRLPVQNLLVPVLPLTGLSVLGALFGEAAFEPIERLEPALAAHILVSVTAYSILFMAACQAGILTWQERLLRRRHSIVTLRLLPPLETMERLLFLQLWAGVITLTLAIGSGFAFLDDLFAQHVAHHTILALAAWVIYSGLLTGHYLFGWRSHTANYGTLVAFALLVLAYFGSKFVLEVILGR